MPKVILILPVLPLGERNIRLAGPNRILVTLLPCIDDPQPVVGVRALELVAQVILVEPDRLADLALLLQIPSSGVPPHHHSEHLIGHV